MRFRGATHKRGGLSMNRNLNYPFLDKLKELPFIDEIWLFGSRARGDNREKSDIDLAIICPEATENDWTQVLEIIEDADTLLKVDCVRADPQGLSKGLYDHILKDRKVIYAKK